MHFWLSTIGHYLVTRALNRALNGVFGGDARGTKSKKKRALLGHAYCGHPYLRLDRIRNSTRAQATTRNIVLTVQKSGKSSNKEF